METRIYGVYAYCEDDYNIVPSELDDDEFIKESEKQGLVWSLNGFEKGFNDGLISDNWYIRIITK